MIKFTSKQQELDFYIDSRRKIKSYLARAKLEASEDFIEVFRRDLADVEQSIAELRAEIDGTTPV